MSIKILLPISDKPKVKLELGSNIDADNLSEGDDVYLECVVRSKPSVDKVTWIHNVSQGWNGRKKVH